MFGGWEGRAHPPPPKRKRHTPTLLCRAGREVMPIDVAPAHNAPLRGWRGGGRRQVSRVRARSGARMVKEGACGANSAPTQLRPHLTSPQPHLHIGLELALVVLEQLGSLLVQRVLRVGVLQGREKGDGCHSRPSLSAPRGQPLLPCPVHALAAHCGASAHAHKAGLWGGAHGPGRAQGCGAGGARKRGAARTRNRNCKP